ncbi:ATP-grasp domain-containing protein [Patescibacteria group bacterium]|nr:ATP-grasp domain-containing protein [Patescibacteria group bacterium]
MAYFDNLGNRKIIILSTATTGWTKKEIELSNYCLKKVQEEMSQSGYSSQVIEVSTSLELKKKMAAFNPDEVVVFNWVEEIDNLKYGYDVAPRLLEKMKFIYTGNNFKTLRDSGNKVKIKKTLTKFHISTPRYTVLQPHNKDITNWQLYPCILKPAYEHCSYGITAKSVVDNPNALLSRAAILHERYQQPLIVEEFINGCEYFVSAWGYNTPEILPPVCQDYAYTGDYHQQIYDYVAKWKRKTRIFKQCNRRLPAELTTNIPDSLYSEVSQAIIATGCQGYTRVDVRVQGETAYVIDINPNPDITPDSDFVIASSRLGYNYGETILKLCDLAIENATNTLPETSIATPSLPISPAFATISP